MFQIMKTIAEIMFALSCIVYGSIAYSFLVATNILEIDRTLARPKITPTI